MTVYDGNSNKLSDLSVGILNCSSFGLACLGTKKRNQNVTNYSTHGIL